jgi:hypothetical protein
MEIRIMKAFLRCSIIAAVSLAACSPLAYAENRLINGTPVPPEEHPEIINIRTGNAGCTATVIGPKVGITAGHCGATGATTQARINGKVYTGKITRSSIYPRKDHDVALILWSEDVVLPQGKGYATVTTAALAAGVKIQIYGYGCTNAGGTGGNDGVLRTGPNVISAFSAYDAVSQEPGGGALCYGDSGGPAYREVTRGFWALATINSKGNIKDRNYTARLDLPESKTLFDDFIATNKVDICGINKDCVGNTPPPGTTFTVENNAVKMVVTTKAGMDADYVKVAVENLARFLDSQVQTADPTLVHPIGPAPELDHDIVNPIGPAKP